MPGISFPQVEKGFREDFSLDPDQLTFRDSVTHFANAELANNILQNNGSGELNREAFKKCGEFGIQGLPIPPEYGGSGAELE